MDDLARQTEEVAGNGDVGIDAITKTLVGARKITDRLIWAKNGQVLTEQEEQPKKVDRTLRLAAQ